MLISALFLLVISVSMGLEPESYYLSKEEEDQRASMCYPIVKPLLRYFEVCQTRDRTNTELQGSLNEINRKYSILLEKHSAAQEKCTAYAVNCKEMHNKLNHTSRELRHFRGCLHRTNIKLGVVQNRPNEVTVNYSEGQGTLCEGRLKENINRNNMKYAELENRFRHQNRELIESRRSLIQNNLKNHQLQEKLNEVNLQNAKLRVELEKKTQELYHFNAQITEISQNIHIEDETFSVNPKVDIDPQKPKNIDEEYGSGWWDDFK